MPVTKHLSVQLKGNEKCKSIHVGGDIISSRIKELSRMVESIEKAKCSRLILDLTQVTFVDSYGLGAFVYYHTMLSKAGTELLVAANGALKETLTSCNLDKVLNIVDPFDLLADFPLDKTTEK
ncbi:MAG: STAS domain-containing protein [Chitinivibrionales bacterium]|nr:STAS domain-containing protein [Chitinivibrionales bacterium]